MCSHNQWNNSVCIYIVDNFGKSKPLACNKFLHNSGNLNVVDVRNMQVELN